MVTFDSPYSEIDTMEPRFMDTSLLRTVLSEYPDERLKFFSLRLARLIRSTDNFL